MSGSSEDNAEKTSRTAELGLGGDSFVRASTAGLDGRGSKPLMDPELGEDFFERQAREEKARAQSRPLSGAATLSYVENTVGKAIALIDSLEPRVELLMQACQTAKKPIPGVEFGHYKHPVTPQTQKIIVYVSRAIGVKEALRKRVQVAVFRFKEAAEVVERARAGLESGELEAGIHEELKLKFYYLTNFHEEFRIDPVLTQVFPPPKEPVARPGTGVMARPGTGMIPKADAMAQRQQLDATFQQAQQVVNELAGHLGFFAKAIDLVDRNQTGNLSGLFSDPATKRLQACAKLIKNDPMLLVKLKGDRKLYDELLAHTKEHYRTSNLEHLKETLEAFMKLRASWLQHPVLRGYMGAEEAGGKKK